MKINKKTILIILLITFLTVFIQNEKTMFDFFWILIHDFGKNNAVFCSQDFILIHGGWPVAILKYIGSSSCPGGLYFNFLGFLIDFSVLFFVYIVLKQIFNKITHHKSVK